MSESQKTVYQFKILLKNLKPNIWRRIQVPEDYNFEELSNAILSVMGWSGSHLHNFNIKNPITGVKEIIGEKPDEEYYSTSTIWEKEAKIRDFFIDHKSKALYCYDFGDGWDHEVQLMRILPADQNLRYPRCVAGKRACPPEDCGGTGGYMELLGFRKKENPSAEEKERLEWYSMDGDFDPEEFDPTKVIFESLSERKKQLESCCVS